MATLHIEHAITDLDTWLGAFNSFAEARANAEGDIQAAIVVQPADAVPRGTIEDPKASADDRLAIGLDGEGEDLFIKARSGIKAQIEASRLSGEAEGKEQERGEDYGIGQAHLVG